MSDAHANRDQETSPTDDDLWLVRLPDGAIRSMTLEALDEAFQAGELDGSTPVQAPDADSFCSLAVAAGLDDETRGSTHDEPQIAMQPSALPVDAASVGHSPPAPDSYRSEAAKANATTAHTTTAHATTDGDGAELSRDSRDSSVPESSNAPSLSPMVASLAPPSSTFALDRSRADSELPPSRTLDLDLDLDEANLRGGKRRMAVTMAFVAVGMVVFGSAISYVSGTTTPPVAASKRTEEVAAPPPAVDPASAFAKPNLSEEQKKRLAEADKARTGRKDKSGAPSQAPAKTPTKEAASPFHQGGDKFDPLNGGL